MKYIGIDPGTKGAMVCVENDEIIDRVQFTPKPLTTKGWAKYELDGDQVGAFIFRPHVQDSNFAAIETFNPMKNNNNSTIATLFRSIGLIEGILFAAGIPTVHIVTGDWQRRYNLIGKDKKESIRVAQVLFPNIGKLLVKQADIAEAAIIGNYAKRYHLPLLKRASDEDTAGNSRKN